MQVCLWKQAENFRCCQGVGSHITGTSNFRPSSYTAQCGEASCILSPPEHMWRGESTGFNILFILFMICLITFLGIVINVWVVVMILLYSLFCGLSWAGLWTGPYKLSKQTHNLKLYPECARYLLFQPPSSKQILHCILCFLTLLKKNAKIKLVPEIVS